MKQIEVYTKALEAMVSAKYRYFSGLWTTRILVTNARTNEECVYRIDFRGLCHLLSHIQHFLKINHIPYEPLKFIEDSERILGRELSGSGYWFLLPHQGCTKARLVRIDHLKELIKLYENGYQL